MVGSVVCYHPTCSWKSAGAFLQQCQVYPKQQLLVQSWGLMYAAIQLPVGSQLEPFFNSTKYILIEFSSIEPSISHVYPKKQLLVPWWGLFYITSKHPVGSQLEPFFNNTKYIPSTRCWYRAGVPFMLPSNLQQQVNCSLSSIGTKYIPSCSFFSRTKYIPCLFSSILPSISQVVVASKEPSISLEVFASTVLGSLLCYQPSSSWKSTGAFLQQYQVYPKYQLLILFWV